MIYIAHPFDQATTYDAGGNSVPGMIEQVRYALDACQVPAFWPTRPYQNPQMSPRAMYDISEFALRRCSALLAIAPSGVASIGVPMEILTAHQLDRPVAVVGSGESVQLRAMGIRQYEPDEIVKAVTWIAEMAVRFGDTTSIKWTGDPECEPRRGYEGDAGWDLVVSESTSIPYNGFRDVPCGISVEFPPGYWGRITGRSSTIRRRKILVNEGVIDNGYRGELFAACWNLGDKGIVIERGERIAQLIPYEVTADRLGFGRAEQLSESARGTKSFGSTGT